MELAAIYLEDACCHYFVVRVHDTDLEFIYLEKRMWLSKNGGVDLDKFINEHKPNEIELYEWIDKHSKITHMSQDTEHWADRDFGAVDSIEIKTLKAEIMWILAQHRAAKSKKVGI